MINPSGKHVRRLKIAEGVDAISEGGNSDERGSSFAGIDQMSPMHPPKPVIDHSHEPDILESSLDKDIDKEGTAESSNGSWVGIFSPVLNFLKNNEDYVDEKIDEPSSDANVETSVDGDGDVTMTDHVVNTTNNDHYSTSSRYNQQHETNVEPSCSLDDSIDDNSCGDKQHHDDEELDDEEFNPYLFI